MMGSYTSYVRTASTLSFVNACTLPGVTPVLTNTDDGTSTATMPFAFRFYDVMTSSVWFSSNGVVGFGTASSSYSNTCLPSPGGPRPAIMAFWDDLATRATGVCAGTVGTAPNRQFVITWNDAQPLGDGASHMTFSVVLSEGTNTVDIVYQTMTGSTRAQGDSATIGVQNSAGTAATQFSCNTAGSVMSGTAIRFNPM